jgi:hypothetical protein
MNRVVRALLDMVVDGLLVLVLDLLGTFLLLDDLTVEVGG